MNIELLDTRSAAASSCKKAKDCLKHVISIIINPHPLLISNEINLNNKVTFKNELLDNILNWDNFFGSCNENKVAGFVIFSQWFFSFFKPLRDTH